MSKRPPDEPVEADDTPGDLKPLAIIEPREWYSSKDQRRDGAISRGVLTIGLCALVGALAYWTVPVLLGPKQAQACPTTSAQLNAYEYELQNRRCEVVVLRQD